jgi:cell division transport system permease protein
MTATTIAIAILVFAGFLVLSHNLRLAIDRFRTTSRIDVLLDDPANPIEIAAAIHRLPGVAATRHYTREDALKYFRESHGEELTRGITEALGGLPFPPFIEVTLAAETTDPSELAKAIARVPNVAEVLYGRETVARMARIAGVVQTASRWIGGVMALFVLLIVINGVRAAIHAREKEIAVLKMIGASDGMIRSPFILEGAVLCAIGATLGLGAIHAGFTALADRIDFIQIEFLPPEIVAATAVFALAIGLLGGVIAVREASDAAD